ncbi:AcrR family transcriptional regulator [Marmoricola sp. OAE513]|uniref:TetR/AcrR family transcriptional regulator n=1 Tax=Marmoricola sp. OAE513 TaxID=2817894 RepID=UPI001AE50816
MTADPAPRRRGRPPLEGRRDEILDAAVEVMAARGIEGTSLAQLAEELGLSTYALTYHFGSKDGLLTAIAGHVETHLQQEFDGLAALGDPSARTLVTGYWAKYGRTGAAGSTRLWLELALIASRDPDRFPGFLDAMVDGWRRTIVTFIGDEHPHAEQIASIAFATILGLELLELHRPGTVTETTLDGLVALYEISAGTSQAGQV